MKLSWVVTCAATIAAVSWQDRSPQFVAKTELVRIDVLASRNGKPIVGLKRDDFIVTDNGVLQTIDRVTGVRSPVEAWLILDQSGSVRGRSAELNVALRTFLGQLDAADLANVITFRHGLRLFPGVSVSVEAVNGALAETSEGYGGRVVRVSEPSKLAQAFVAVLAEARARYVLTYYPSRVARTGWHEIKVRLRSGQGDIRARRGYMADPVD